MSEPPRDPTIGLPSWPSSTARSSGVTSSRQQEREARDAAEQSGQQRIEDDPAERRHRELIRELTLIRAHLTGLSDQLATIDRGITELCGK